jgi:hypothetical protein
VQLQCLGITQQDIEGFLETERQYLSSLKTEDPEIVTAAEYIEKLQKLQQFR